RLARALDEFVIEGVRSTISFHKTVLAHPRFIAGDYDTHFIDQIMDLVDYEPEADRPSCMSLILEKRITQNAGKDPTRDH
ncbi:MAG: hypothetical protein ACE5F1_17630, partial [Planctomycetota bacterium]